jgi:hypothetical protein
MAVTVTRDDGTVVEYENGNNFEIDRESHGHLIVLGEVGSLAIYAPGRWCCAEVETS